MSEQFPDFSTRIVAGFTGSVVAVVLHWGGQPTPPLTFGEVIRSFLAVVLGTAAGIHYVPSKGLGVAFVVAGMIETGVHMRELLRDLIKNLAAKS